MGGCRKTTHKKAEILENAGADFIMLASNTMHYVAPQIEASIHVPFLHIVDATAEAVKQQKIKTVGLLGTKNTMTQNFHRDRFSQKGVRTITPNNQQRETIHKIIRDELVLGVIKESSRRIYVDIIQDLADAGAEGVVLGCTEIDFLIKPTDTPYLPLFDTTLLHCQKAVKWALGIEPMLARQ